MVYCDFGSSYVLYFCGRYEKDFSISISSLASNFRDDVRAKGSPFNKLEVGPYASNNNPSTSGYLPDDYPEGALGGSPEWVELAKACQATLR
jgi:hypothetical protein